MLSTLTLVVARSILLVVMIFSAVLTVLWTSVYICALFLLSFSRTSFNISPFPVNWVYSAYSAVLDGKRFRGAYHCEKLLSRTAERVCRS